MDQRWLSSDSEQHQLVATPGFPAPHDLWRERSDAVDAFLEGDAHPHEEMGLDVAMERPDAGVVGPEPQRRPAVGVHRDGVLENGVPEVVGRRVHRRVEAADAVAQHPEVVAVQVPRVRLALVGRQHVGVLQHHVDDGAEPQAVQPVAGGGVGVGRDGVDVVPPVRVRLRRRALVEGVQEPRPLHGHQVGRVRQREGHAVERPLDVRVDLVLCVEQEDGAVGARRRRLDVGRVRHRRHALPEPVRGVVPGGPRGRRRRRRPARAAAPAVVAEHGGARRRARLAADHVGGEPVVAVGVLVRLDQHGVGLARVDVEVLHHERLHVVPVRLHHRHFVALKPCMHAVDGSLLPVQVHTGSDGWEREMHSIIGWGIWHCENGSTCMHACVV
jgi:hypothetical protein